MLVLDAEVARKHLGFKRCLMRAFGKIKIEMLLSMNLGSNLQKFLSGTDDKRREKK